MWLSRYYIFAICNNKGYIYQKNLMHKHQVFLVYRLTILS